MSAEQPSADDSPDRPGEWLSNLVDGQHPGGGLDKVCRDWSHRADLRRDWHAYHLIGDVMRSDELSSPPARDAAFLQALRRRLSEEPVPLAPRAVPAPAATVAVTMQRPRRWLLPVAAAAGFAAVGVSVMTLGPGAGAPTGWNQPIAVVQPAAGDALRQSVGSASAASSPALVLDGQIIRDARLDAYFEAHRGAAGPTPSAVPGGALRSVELLVPQR